MNCFNLLFYHRLSSTASVFHFHFSYWFPTILQEAEIDHFCSIKRWGSGNITTTTKLSGRWTQTGACQWSGHVWWLNSIVSSWWRCSYLCLLNKESLPVECWWKMVSLETSLWSLVVRDWHLKANVWCFRKLEMVTSQTQIFCIICWKQKKNTQLTRA